MPEQNVLTGIALKIASVTVFVGMAAMIKAAGQVPAGQIVFFRSFFALFPILALLAWRRELATCLYTTRPMGHVTRSLVGVLTMSMLFYALTRLPLPEATALSYAQPLMVVIFGALMLGEPVRIYRWSAVVAGLVGVAIVSWPKLTLFGSDQPLGDEQMYAVLAVLLAATTSAFANILIRTLVMTDRTATIVVWFSGTCSVLSLLTIPFGWDELSTTRMAYLVGGGILGGIGQILMTESYRHASPSVVAPFEYLSLVLAIAVGYVVFSDVPTIHVIVGGVIVIAAGIFIILRERRLAIERARASRDEG